MRVLLQIQACAFSLDCSSERVKRTGSRVASPGEHQLSGAAGRDHLIVDEVWGEAAKCQVTAALADDLVARRKANQVGEAFDQYGVAVMNMRRDRVTHADDLRHCGQSSSARQASIMFMADATAGSFTSIGGPH